MGIHKNSAIHPKAELGKNVSVGPFTSIGPGVRIGDETTIGPNVLIETGTVIGRNCQIFHGASIGCDPQMVGLKSFPSFVEIGDGTIIREFVTIHRSIEENGKTRLGKECMLMNYVHVAHDGDIGDNVIIVNGTGLSGHVLVEERAFISGFVGVHQFVRIGKQSMIGGAARIIQDVVPFSLVEGSPARLRSINALGLRRNNYKPAVCREIKKALKLLHNSELNTSQAIERIEAEIEMLDEIRYLIQFIKSSSRGVIK